VTIQVAENVYFVENPFRKPGYFTGTTILLGETVSLIDVGTAPAAEASIFPAIKRLDRSPEEIGLIVLTQGHRDHCGSAAQIAQRTGAKIACHHLEVPFV
jgi:glyoxylase-like metal-dependent hydrolase (beta-lactamase superfamily II)